MKPKPAIITWQDAWRDSDRECYPDKMLDMGRRKCMRENVGFVIEKTKEHVIFVDGIFEFEEGDVILSGQHSIPMAMVKKIKYLK